MRLFPSFTLRRPSGTKLAALSPYCFPVQYDGSLQDALCVWVDFRKSGLFFYSILMIDKIVFFDTL